MQTIISQLISFKQNFINSVNFTENFYNYTDMILTTKNIKSKFYRLKVELKTESFKEIVMLKSNI